VIHILKEWKANLDTLGKRTRTIELRRDYDRRFCQGDWLVLIEVSREGMVMPDEKGRVVATCQLVTWVMPVDEFTTPGTKKVQVSALQLLTSYCDYRITIPEGVARALLLAKEIDAETNGEYIPEILTLLSHLEDKKSLTVPVNPVA